MTSTVVGSLACQKNSFLKTLNTTVVSCVEKKGKKYQVELFDTVLFPEGGGQPSDLGTITLGDTTINVSHVERVGLYARHITDLPVSPGDQVTLNLDWKKRFDHMQQHTGQHLLSAVMDKYDLPTLSWSMGEMVNYIEIPRKLESGEVESIESEVTSLINQSLEIVVETPENTIKEGKLPKDYDFSKGTLRIVKIGDMDANPCCGTHLTSTSQIKSIALLNQTPGKSSNTRLNFLAGDRVTEYSKFSYQIVKSVCNTLSCQDVQAVEKVDMVSRNLKKATSRENNLLKEIASYKCQEIKESLGGKDLVYFHRADVGLEFLNMILKEFSPLEPSKTLVLACGEGPSGGAIIITGEKVDEVSKQTKEILTNLKGGGKGKFQGKVTSFDKGQLESLRNYLESI